MKLFFFSAEAVTPPDQKKHAANWKQNGTEYMCILKQMHERYKGDCGCYSAKRENYHLKQYCQGHCISLPRTTLPVQNSPSLHAPAQGNVLQCAAHSPLLLQTQSPLSLSSSSPHGRGLAPARTRGLQGEEGRYSHPWLREGRPAGPRRLLCHRLLRAGHSPPTAMGSPAPPAQVATC